MIQQLSMAEKKPANNQLSHFESMLKTEQCKQYSRLRKPKYRRTSENLLPQTCKYASDFSCEI